MLSANIVGHQMDVEFGYYYVGVDNASPELQTNFVPILGLNGTLDLSEQDGSVFYDSVERSWRFEKVTKTTEYDDVERESRVLRRAIIGKSGAVIFDADENYYYNCRITKVDVSCEDDGRLVCIVTAHCDPYRYRVVETVVGGAVSTSRQFELVNSAMEVSPLVVLDAEMTLSYTIRGSSFEVVMNAGSHYSDTLVLYEGTTNVTVTGNGNIEFRYRQGEL